MILPLYDKMRQDKYRLNAMFFPSPKVVFRNICYSFIPPFFSRFSKLASDVIGPAFAILIITAILNYASFKQPYKTALSPTEFMLGYSLFVPSISYFLCKKVAKSRLCFKEIASLLGYSLYSHILTLFLSMIYLKEDMERHFFFCMIYCTGCSTIRIIIILSKSIRIPAIRLLVIAFIIIAQMLCLIYQYFAYINESVY